MWEYSILNSPDKLFTSSQILITVIHTARFNISFEIKSSSTINEKFFNSLNKISDLFKISKQNINVLYSGEQTFPATPTHGGYISWKDW